MSAIRSAYTTSLRERMPVVARADVHLILGGIVLLAIAVRFVGIGSRLSIDDAYSWFAASSPNAHVFLHRLADNENTPPLIYLVLMLMPGTSPVWLRIPAAIPGVLMCVVVFYALRPRLGDRASLLAALAVAVSPYLITYSNLARGFMLADLALLVAVWAVLSLAERETSVKWVTLFVAGTVAVWTEYASVICLIALIASAVWIGRPRRRPTLLVGGLAVASLAPWIPEIIRGQRQVGVTKFDPLSATPSVRALRDMFVTLAFGENGGTSSSVGRWLLFLVMLLVGGVAALVLRRRWSSRSDSGRFTIRLLAATAGLTLVGYAAAAVVGIDVFTQRYITIEIPLIAALGAAALVDAPMQWVVPVASVLLVGLGIAGVARRYRGEWAPNLVPIRAAAMSMHPRTVLTNTPVVLYYMPSLRPMFDRPYNLGAGMASTCARPCVVVDDAAVHGGTPRPVIGRQTVFGRYILTFEP